MSVRNRLNNPKHLIRIGMACLLIAILSQRFLHPTAIFGSELIDGVRGVLYGLSIGFNLWAVRLAGRHGCGDWS